MTPPKTITCLVCGQDHRPTSLLCGDCHRLADRDIAMEESILRRRFLREKCRWAGSLLAVRKQLFLDREYMQIAKTVYAQARARIDESLTTGYVNDMLREKNALIRLE